MVGNLRKEVSPDRGTTLYGYDEAGNMTCKADGRYTGSATVCENVANAWTYQYDALNRLTSIDYGATTGTEVTLQWDTRSAAATQVGRLRQVTYVQGDLTVTRRMDYDAWGNVTWSQQETDDGTTTKTLTTSYQYDGNDQLKQITYPSGRVVDYTRSANGRITSISATFQGTTTTVVSAVGYSATPFGAPHIFTYGNGLQRAATFDQSYAQDQLILWDPGIMDFWDARAYAFDDAGNIESIEDGIDTDRSRSYDYDGLNRLTWDSGVSATSPTYSYDGNGNRTHREAAGSDEQDFTIAAGSNQIASYTLGGTALDPGYDDMGNVESYLFVADFNYDAGGRLSSVWDLAGIYGLQMAYNGLGELARAKRYTTDACTNEEVVLALEYFTFAPDGRALELVSGNSSRTESDWVWLDGQPVAQFTDSYDASGTYQGTAVTYLYADHLGTPRIGTDANKAITWRYQSDAFGVGTPSGTAAVRLRLPGQIDLGILGLNYNYFRDYDSSTGRYLESDPIGIEGGLNTYGYVEQNPLSFIDPNGLHPGAIIAAFCEANPVACGAAAAAIVTAVRNSLNPPAVPSPREDDSCDDDEFCRTERERCIELCTDAQSDPDRRRVYGGSMSQCIRSCLPEQCGGEPKWKGFLPFGRP
jgi:RHS repeat-associated protein